MNHHNARSTNRPTELHFSWCQKEALWNGYLAQNLFSNAPATIHTCFLSFFFRQTTNWNYMNIDSSCFHKSTYVYLAITILNMKTYHIEPTYKKSVCEVELWRKREDIQESDSSTWRYNWNGPILRKECWWRWADWTIDIPETEEEIQEFLSYKPFENLEAYLDHHGGETIEECLLGSLPVDDDDSCCLPEEAEMMSCWDGQGEEFKIQLTRDLEISEEDRQQMASEAEEAYNGEDGLYEEGLENLGWEHYETFYEVYCKLKIELQETEEEKQARLFNEFQSLLRNDLKSYPEKLGNIFEAIEDTESYEEDDEAKELKTRYDDAVKKFGEEKVFKTLLDEIPTTLTCAFEGEVTAVYPANVVAAQLPNANMSVIYQLLRENPDICNPLF